MITMGTTTEDLQRSAWRELYEMLSSEIELDIVNHNSEEAQEASDSAE